MPIIEQTDSATLVIPGAYVKQSFLSDRSGAAVSGVVVLVGEADGGADFSLEDDLELACSWGPDQAGEVAAKYLSGPLVDAFRIAASPSNDVRVPGAPTRIITIKTNPSVKATSEVDRFDTTAYGVLADKSYGKKGNLINYTITAETSEVIPTTGSFTYIPPAEAFNYNMRANGAAAVGGTISANTAPDAFVSTVAALSGVLATGGTNRSVHAALGNLSLTVVSGNAVQVATTVAWGTTPTVGDTLVIPNGSVIAGGGGENIGAYVITGATSTTINATKLSDAGATSPTAGVITAPVTVGAIAWSGTPANDLRAYAPVTITLEAGDPLDGRGKSLEIAQLTTGDDLMERCCFLLGTTTAVSWISKSGAAYVLTSASEYSVNLEAARQLDNLSEELIAGGEIALRIGYLGTTATLTISDTALTTSVTGGSGANLSLDLADYPTLADLASYIASQTGYTCSVGTAVLGTLPPTALDDLSAVGICSTWGAANGRCKIDAFRLFDKISKESVLLQLQNADGDVEQASAGLPAPVSRTYLAGGTKGGTTGANFVAALTALEQIGCNFIVPLFSRDAADDIADGLTDSSSTYEIDAMHLALRTHVMDMSKIKKSRNRQGFASIQTTFADAREKAANLASFRVAMTFQDVRTLASDGTLKQFQPWASAALAAAMQAAGFYRPIVRKKCNISGALQAAGDFDDRNDTQVENALLSGLLPLRRDDAGGVFWVSDQNTNVGSPNPMLNSVQSIYVADQISANLRIALDEAFVGESLADVPAALIASKVDAKMGDFRRLKLITASDDAPKGYKNLSVKISGPSARVKVEVKSATGLYFIPIDLLFSQVTQSA